jgi:hypothetical protein
VELLCLLSTIVLSSPSRVVSCPRRTTDSHLRPILLSTQRNLQVRQYLGRRRIRIRIHNMSKHHKMENHTLPGMVVDRDQTTEDFQYSCMREYQVLANHNTGSNILLRLMLSCIPA